MHKSNTLVTTTLLILVLWQFICTSMGFCNTNSKITKRIRILNDQQKIKKFFIDHPIYLFPSIPVDPSNVNYFSTPIFWFNDSLYVINLEPPDGKPNGINVKTVIRKYGLGNDGKWYWDSHVIEDRTIEDRYHTQPSLGIDKEGYIHVAYNMHNMPWQYSISKNSEDISAFEFKGEFLSSKELSIVKNQNKTPFPEIGKAPIPGTQITYPAFFIDRNGELYITYRFSLSPKKKWNNRRFAGGIAKYNAKQEEWVGIGGSMLLSNQDAEMPYSTVKNSYSIKTFAYQENWTVYLIKLFFDIQNSMHVSWTWRENGAGPDCSHPSYAFLNNSHSILRKSNGKPYNAPISMNHSDIVFPSNITKKFYANTSISADPSGTPYIILHPIGSPRILLHYDSSNNRWTNPETSPYSASEIYIDDSGMQWAFASGITVASRSSVTTWKKVFSEKGYGWPKIHFSKHLQGFFIHALSNDRKMVKIIWVSANTNF